MGLRGSRTLLEEIYKNGIPILICGFIIKLMDDYIDDTSSPIVISLGKGILPYSLILIIIASSFNLKLTGGLFLSAYIIGMINQTDVIFPSGLNGFVELILGLIIGLWICGSKIIFLGILWMSIIQIIDDYIDQKPDLLMGHFNLWNRFPVPPLMIILISFVSIVFIIEPFLSVIILLCYMALELIDKYILRRTGEINYDVTH